MNSSVFSMQILILIVDFFPIYLVQNVFMLIWIYLLCECKCSDAKLEQDLITNFHKIARNILPLLKKGDSEAVTRLFDYKNRFIFSLLSMLLLLLWQSFGKELFIQEYVYEPGLERSLFCYESIWSADCSKVNCTNLVCYKFDLNFWKSII